MKYNSNNVLSDSLSHFARHFCIDLLLLNQSILQKCKNYLDCFLFLPLKSNSDDHNLLSSPFPRYLFKVNKSRSIAVRLLPAGWLMVCLSQKTESQVLFLDGMWKSKAYQSGGRATGGEKSGISIIQM